MASNNLVFANLRRSITATVANSAITGGGSIFPVLQAMAEAINSGLKSRRSFENAHKTLAASAMEATLNAYAANVEAEGPPPYRENSPSRMSGGMRRALEDPGMYRGTFSGVYLFSRKILDSNARHWYRLNSGVVGYGGSRGERFNTSPSSLNVGGGNIGMIGLNLPVDPKPMYMPRGYFTPEGAFYPKPAPADIPTKGIQARRFLEAGAEAVAIELPVVYEDLLRKLLKTAAQTGKGAGTAIRTVPPGY